MEDKSKISHELIPEHIKLSQEEKEAVLKKYNVAERMLPSILVDDAGLNGLDALPGDIIKVLRKSATKGVSEFYRVVIHG